MLFGRNDIFNASTEFCLVYPVMGAPSKSDKFGCA